MRSRCDLIENTGLPKNKFPTPQAPRSHSTPEFDETWTRGYSTDALMNC